MPKLACWSCGRQIYTVAPLEALFAEERRCPRCGAFLRNDRREDERRLDHRRANPPDDPGPPRPEGTSKGTAKAASDAERRTADRRTTRRRGGGKPSFGHSDPAGWRD